SVGFALETGLKLLHEHLNLPENLSETRVVIQGFDNVGLEIAKFLTMRGATVIAINDQRGTLYKSDGININIAKKYSCAANEKQSITNYPGGKTLERDEIINIDCDIFVLCAFSANINEKTATSFKTKYIVESTNNTITARAEQQLFRKGVIILPFILTNAGSVICSYAEHKRMNSVEAFSLTKSKTVKNTEMVIERSLNSNLIPRKVAKDIAQQRVIDAVENRN
ncbi:MAG: hypothetical protein ACXADX_20485, partial [Candidatus Hodarchaeales archaeon]